MLTCLVIDDEPLAGKLIADYVRKSGDLELAGTFTDPIEALHFLDGNPVDLLFLDIQMPELTGIQLMKINNGRSHVILTTAYEEFALDGFEFDVIDYLLKPISFDRFLIAVNKAKKRIEPKDQALAGSPTETPDYIFVKSSYKLLKMDLSGILYMEGLGDYVAIHTAEDKILTLENMRSFEQQLPENRFARVHKSYIVSIDKIKFIEKNRIVIGKKYIPISDTYKESFFEKINRP